MTVFKTGLRGGASAGAPQRRGAGPARVPQHALAQPSADDLVTYWRALRDGRALPSPLDLDRRGVASRWRNSGLLSYAADGGATGDPMPRALPLAPAQDGGSNPQEIPLSGDLVASILDLADRTLELGRPVRETIRVAEGDGPVEAVMLPLSLGGDPDHVLYHLRRACVGSAAKPRF
jgi:hypothetical protein